MSIGPGRLGRLLYVVIAEPTATAAGRHAATEAHLAYLAEIEASGHLFLAGPTVDDAGQSTGGGLFVLRAASRAEAEAIAARDPYNAGGYRRVRVQPWRLDQGAFGIDVSLTGGSIRLR